MTTDKLTNWNAVLAALDADPWTDTSSQSGSFVDIAEVTIQDCCKSDADSDMDVDATVDAVESPQMAPIPNPAPYWLNSQPSSQASLDMFDNQTSPNEISQSPQPVIRRQKSRSKRMPGVRTMLTREEQLLVNVAKYNVEESASSSSAPSVVPSQVVLRNRKRLSLEVVAEGRAKRTSFNEFAVGRPATIHISSPEDTEHLADEIDVEEIDSGEVAEQSTAPVNEDWMVRLRSQPRQAVKIRYFPSLRQTFGSGSRRTTTVAKWSSVYYHREIAGLFAQQANKGVYTRCGVSGMGIKEVFDIEHGIWHKCVEMMSTLPYVHVHGAIWGKRSNTLNLSAQKTYGLPNPFFIPASKLNDNISVMKKLISTHRRSMAASPEGKKWQIFLICTLVRDVKALEESLLHTMALIVDCSLEKTEYYLYDPMERSNPYKMPAFVRKFKGLSYGFRLHMIFGNQMETEMDCFHRTIDWVAGFLDGAVNFGGKFEYVVLHNRNDAWHNLLSD